MSFEPMPGLKINLDGETVEFVALEASGPASVFVYAEAGKEGTVYKVLKNKKQYALKVFYPQYQDKRLIKNTERLSQYKTMKGLRVAERTLINRKTHPNLVGEIPELNYSILMPWIQGTIWGNLMESEHPLQSKNYFRIAKILMEIVCNMENQGLAHCDLSNNNFIIDPTLSSIELIDIENMFAPDMPRPVPDISYGAIGYRTKWIAENGLWGSTSDRFASAILCSEIMTWHNKEIRDNKVGDTSFFDEEEIGEKSERFRIMKSYLGKLGDDLPVLFEKTWFSKKPDQCPSVCEWEEVVSRIARERARYEQQNLASADQKLVDGVLSETMEKSLREKAEYEERRVKPTKKFKISISYPKLLSKRYESSFLLQIYLPEERSQVTRNVKLKFRGQKVNEQLKSSSIKFGQKIRVKLFSPVFDFPESVTKLIDSTISKVTFLGMPKDSCEPGLHKVLVSVSDADTDQEFESFTVSVKVVDFSFDHISRPLVSRVSAVILSIGSFVMFILTFLEQIDKTIGLTSGATAGVFALGIYASFYNLYQRVRPNTP